MHIAVSSGRTYPQEFTIALLDVVLQYLNESIMERLDLGHLYPRWEASTLEKTFEQLVNSYSEHLHMSQWAWKI